MISYSSADNPENNSNARFHGIRAVSPIDYRIRKAAPFRESRGQHPILLSDFHAR